MGVGHVPQEPVRAEGQGADVQGRQRRRAPAHGGLTAGAADLSKIARGRWGETEVARWYERHGYTILDRNWRCSHGELDVVARSADTVVFCEVKSRADNAYGGGAAAVGWDKQRRLRRLAAAWLSATGVHGVEVRFDVAAVTGTRIDVIHAAF